MKHKHKKIGLPPGSVVFTGTQQLEQVEVHHLKYNDADAKELQIDRKVLHVAIEETDAINWYDLRGMHDVNLLEQLGKAYQIHPLALEAIPDIHQRPKFEEYDNGILINCKALHFNKTERTLSLEHVAIYLRTGLIFTFQETESDLFHQLRQRILQGRGRVRHRGADYLAYALLDLITDHYFVVLDSIESEIEALEDRLLEDHTTIHKTEIHQLRKELQKMRKVVMPLREAISRFSKSESSYLHESTEIYVRDLYDHVIQVLDMTDTFRDNLNSLQDLFLSEVSTQMNQVMQVLTLVATIFIPLTFIAGIYGMNFKYIPELEWQYGYFYFWGMIFLLGSGLYIYFRHKKWI